MNHQKVEDTKSSQLADLKPLFLKHGYTLVELIGAGGFAHVYKVYSAKYGQNFAAKVFNMLLPSMVHNVTSYSSEIQMLKQLIHPNVVSIYEHFQESHFLVIILEHCPRGNIGDLIQDDVGVASYNLIPLCKDIITAFRYLHSQKIAHCDIKPGNILLDIYNRVKVADFGSAQKIDGITGKIWRKGGSKHFLAPEVISDNSFNAFKADVFSLGVTFYLIMSGRLPKWKSSHDDNNEVKDNNYNIVNSKYSGDLRFPDSFPRQFIPIVTSMLNIDPENRPTLEDLAQNEVFSDSCSSIEQQNESDPNDNINYCILNNINNRLKGNKSDPITKSTELIETDMFDDTQKDKIELSLAASKPTIHHHSLKFPKHRKMSQPQPQQIGDAKVACLSSSKVFFMLPKQSSTTCKTYMPTLYTKVSGPIVRSYSVH